MWCDKTSLCLCEAMGHENDNTEITIWVYSRLGGSLRPPDGVCCGGGAHQDLVKNDPGEHVACDRVCSQGIVWFYLTFNSTRQVSISHQIVQTRANVCGDPSKFVLIDIKFILPVSDFSRFQLKWGSSRNSEAELITRDPNADIVSRERYPSQ